MQNKINSVLLKILPFVAIGIFIVILVVGLVIFSYLLIVGAIVGIILFCISWIWSRLFYRKQQRMYQKSSFHSGRTIDSEEEKK